MDKESNLADHGVRKYENEVGIFTSIDPLWEQYRGWTPYQYAGNNPIMALDWNGKWITTNNSGFLIDDMKANFFLSDNIEFSYEGGKLKIFDKRIFPSKSTAADPTYNNHEFNDALKSIQSYANSPIEYNVHYMGLKEPVFFMGKPVSLNKNNEPATLEDFGGELVYQNRIIYINESDNTHNWFLTEGINKRQDDANDYRHNNLMHGFGHIMFELQPQGKVIDFDNLMRFFSGYPMRGYDKKHPKP